MFRPEPLRDSLVQGADLAAERAGRLLVRVLKTILVGRGKGGTRILPQPLPH